MPCAPVASAMARLAYSFDQFSGRDYQVSFEGAIHLDRRGKATRVKAMRDFIADWKKWSAAERVLAVVIALAIVAVPAIGAVRII
jgi:hypothetical protein